MREDLDSCMDGEVTVDEVWTDALHALRCLRAPIDEATLERLFWRENRMVSRLSPIDCRRGRTDFCTLLAPRCEWSLCAMMPA